jgi:transmembrane sensor
MSNAETARDIDESAAAWAVQRETRGDDPAFIAELNAWLEGDSRRAGALLRAEAALTYLNRGRALGTASTQPNRDRRISRRLFVVGGAVASLAAGVATLALLWPLAQRYETAIGEVRKLPLSDGSIATLNTASELKVEMSRDARRLNLVEGEAWFKVAKNPDRPFVVESGKVRIQALGTAFSVRRRDDGATVLVTEGSVDVWVEGQENQRTKVAAGEKALVVQGQPPQSVAATAEIEHALAWRYGQISLFGETLAEAAAEFNRHNTRKIVVSDPALGAEKVVGGFNADDPEGFARAAARMFGAQVSADDSTLRLYR